MRARNRCARETDGQLCARASSCPIVYPSAASLLSSSCACANARRTQETNAQHCARAQTCARACARPAAHACGERATTARASRCPNVRGRDKDFPPSPPPPSPPSFFSSLWQGWRAEGDAVLAVLLMPHPAAGRLCPLRSSWRGWLRGRQRGRRLRPQLAGRRSAGQRLAAAGLARGCRPAPAGLTGPRPQLALCTCGVESRFKASLFRLRTEQMTDSPKQPK